MYKGEGIKDMDLERNTEVPDEFGIGRMKEEPECCCNQTEQRKKHREVEEAKDLMHRLNRIEGQVRGVRKMVEEECYCVDILTQVSAIQSALSGFSRTLLGNHLKTCVVRDMKEGREEAVDELLELLRKFMK